MRRFFLTFLLLQGVLFAIELTPPIQRWVVQPFTGELATVSGALISGLGREIHTEGSVIYDMETSFAVMIAAGCNGVEAMILLMAAILAFPSSLKNKLLGLLAGFAAIQALNLVRIVSLFFLGLWHEAAFEWAHLYLWQGLIMLDAILIYLLWIHRLRGVGYREVFAR